MITLLDSRGMTTEYKEELSYNHVQFVEKEDGKVTKRYSVHIESMIKILKYFGYEVNKIE